jgi:tetratricopeptide (TPR) repeat protein
LDFLNQLSELRGFGPSDPLSGLGESRQRQEYLEKAKRLQISRDRLSAKDVASHGAYLIRLRRTQPGMPDFEEALRVLEEGRRQYPRDFAILANLATAYQLTGRLDAAASCLQDALDYAPADVQSLERYHLILLRQRAQESPSFGLAPLDRLFVGPDRTPARFVGPSGHWEVGRLADGERQKLPAGSVAEAQRIVQQLLVWFPDDARLLWLYGELANASGDIKAASAALEQAVYIFRLSTPELKEHRFLLQEAVAWHDVLKRAGSEDKQAAWALGLLSRSVPLAPGADLAPRVVDQAVELPRAKDLLSSNLLIGGGGGSSAEAAPVNPFASMGWQGWTAIALGVLLIVALIGLQLRESWRRRTQSPSAAAQSQRSRLA